MAVFPLSVHSSGRYMVDASGNPRPFWCRTSWALVTRTFAQQTDYADDCVAKGFNAVEFGAIWRDPRATQAPAANNGALLPFTSKLGGGSWTGGTSDPDFATPTTAYWDFVVQLVDMLASKGITAVMFPCYHGHTGGSDGWFAEMINNGESGCQSFAAFVANKFITRSNIIWGLGGDLGTAPFSYSTSQRDVERGIINGLLSVGGQASTQYLAEWGSGSIAADQTDFRNGVSGATFGDTCTLQSFYNFDGGVITGGRNAWGGSGPRPGMKQEGPFDEEGSDGTNDNTDASQPVSRYEWWSWLSAIGGTNFGNGYVWRFNLTGTPPASDDYRNHLSSATTLEVSKMIRFANSLQWQKLVPSGLSGMRTLVVANAGSGSGHPTTDAVTAACASDGSFMVAYRPPDHTTSFSLDLRSMNGNSRARKFDPTNGTYTDLTGGAFTLANTLSSQSFTLGTNASGRNDFALLLDTQTPPVLNSYPAPAPSTTMLMGHRSIAAEPLVIIPNPPAPVIGAGRFWTG